MNIAQLSVNYLPEQDRILVKILTQDEQELRLWFTRKLTSGAWPLLNRVVDEHTAAYMAAQPQVNAQDAPARKAMADFKRAEALEKADFATPYKGSPKWMPLGGEPLLVTEIKVTPKPEGRLQLHFSEKLSGAGQGRGFEVTLEQSLMHGLMKLLASSIGAADWQLPALAGSEGAAGGQAAANADERPKYLN